MLRVAVELGASMTFMWYGLATPSCSVRYAPETLHVSYGQIINAMTLKLCTFHMDKLSTPAWVSNTSDNTASTMRSRSLLFAAILLYSAAFCLDLSIMCLFHIHVSGKWIQGDPTECSTECGMAEGHGKAGTVTCNKDICDSDFKPPPKKCPKTDSCSL